MLILVQIRIVKQRGDQMLIKSNQNRRGVQPVISTQSGLQPVLHQDFTPDGKMGIFNKLVS